MNEASLDVVAHRNISVCVSIGYYFYSTSSIPNSTPTKSSSQQVTLTPLRINWLDLKNHM